MKSLASSRPDRWGERVSSRAFSERRALQDFFHGRRALPHFHPTVLAQEAQSALTPSGNDFQRGSALIDELRDFVVHHHQLIQPGTPPIAGLPAILAAFAAEKLLPFFQTEIR